MHAEVLAEDIKALKKDQTNLNVLIANDD